MDTVSIAARVIMSCVIFAYFVLKPLKSRFRYSVCKIFWLAVLLILITLLITVLFLTSGKFLVEYSSAGIVLWIVVATVIFRLMIRGSYLEILFIVLVVLNLYVDIVSIVKTIAISMGIMSLSDIRCIPIMAAVLLIYIPFLWMLMIKLYQQVVEFGTGFSFWKYIWIIPVITYLVYYVKIIDDYWRKPIIDLSEAVSFILLWSVITYAFFWVTLQMLIQTYRGIAANESVKSATTQLRMQEEQYRRLLENIEETSRLRHDWRHHLLTISGFVERENLDGLNTYLKTLYPEYDSNQGGALCQNHVVDIILQHYAVMAEKEDIEFCVRGDIPKELSIKEIDLCIMFGNLVENAVEACMRQSQGKKYIQVRSEIRGKQLVAMVKNTHQGAVPIHHNTCVSSKHSGVGIGLPSVERVVESYGGSMKVEHDEETFTVFLILQVL